MQGEIDRGKMTQDFLAATKYLHKHEDCTGKVSVVGFCFGGRVSNTLAVMIPDVITAAIYEGVNHSFYNDTTPRYDEAIAKLSWKPTIDF